MRRWIEKEKRRTNDRERKKIGSNCVCTEIQRQFISQLKYMSNNESFKDQFATNVNQLAEEMLHRLGVRRARRNDEKQQRKRKNELKGK